MGLRVKLPVTDHDLIRIPRDWQLVSDTGQRGVALRVAPQDEVIVFDVLRLQLLRSLYAGIAPHLTVPLTHSPVELSIHPLVDLGVTASRGGLHKEKRSHDGIIDRTLQAVLLAKLFGGRLNRRDEFPFTIGTQPESGSAGKIRSPRDIHRQISGFISIRLVLLGTSLNFITLV